MRAGWRARLVVSVVMLAIGACTQESLWLGALAWDAGAEGRLDGRAGPAADGSSPTDQPNDEPMSVSLSAGGRDGATRISVACGVECVEVRVKVAGGVPPYEIRWDDGEAGAIRTLCADPQRPRGGVVQDASGGRNKPVSFALAPIDRFSCLSSSEPSRVCFSPEPVASACSQGAEIGPSFDVGKPILAGTRMEAEVTSRGRVVSQSGAATVSPLLLTFSEDCSSESSLGGSYRYLDSADLVVSAFAGGANNDARYITVTETHQLLGVPIPRPVTDAGRPQVESVVLCEYLAAPETGTDAGASP